MTTDKSNKDRCWHYSGVDKGFYCWKCVEHLMDKRTKEIYQKLYDEFDTVANEYGKSYVLNKIKQHKKEWCK